MNPEVENENMRSEACVLKIGVRYTSTSDRKAGSEKENSSVVKIWPLSSPIRDVAQRMPHDSSAA
jgi:hypothetical protein